MVVAIAIFEHKSIITTTPKAKEARTTVERIITFAKKGDVAARREVLRTIRNKDLVKQIFEDIAPKYAERKGGYTRIVKLGNRSGDNADMAIFELVGYEGLKQEKIKRPDAENSFSLDFIHSNIGNIGAAAVMAVAPVIAHHKNRPRRHNGIDGAIGKVAVDKRFA